MTITTGLLLSMMIPFPFFLGASPIEAGTRNTDWGCKSSAQTVDTPVEKGTDSLQVPPTSAEPERDNGGFAIISGKQMQLGGYTQFRLQIFRPEAGKNSGADVRRIRLTLDGKLEKQWQYMFQADFASSPKALDAYVRFSPFASLAVTAGQFKIPFSRENLNSSSGLEFVDRPQVVEALCARSTDVIGNQNGRDIGVQLGGNLIKHDSTYLFEYAAGIFNGSGINTPDKNNAKDFSGRVIFQPVPCVSVGASYYDGFDVWGSPAVSRSRKRSGLEFKYADRSLNFSGEFIAGNDGAIRRKGWYLQGAYFVIQKLLLLGVRYDVYDPDLAACDSTVTNYVIGATYFIISQVKLQANYVIQRGEDARRLDIIEAQLQYGF